MSVESLGGLIVDMHLKTKEDVRGYMEWQAPDEKVRHLEKVKTESVYGEKMEAWDVRTDKGRWWVITNPTNLYSQELFPSLDYTLSFHVGVMTRVSQRNMSTEQVDAHDRINAIWNKLARARSTLFEAEKVEDFQSVGMKCRECLLFLVKSIADSKMVPKGKEKPQKGNFIEWCEIIADHVAAGGSNERLRAYLKTVSKSTWQLVSWLTHAQHASKFDGCIAVDATENVLLAFTMIHSKALSHSQKR